MSEADQPVTVPDWIVLLVGRQTLEVEGLRRQVRALSQPEDDS